MSLAYEGGTTPMRKLGREGVENTGVSESHSQLYPQRCVWRLRYGLEINRKLSVRRCMVFDTEDLFVFGGRRYFQGRIFLGQHVLLEFWTSLYKSRSPIDLLT